MSTISANSTTYRVPSLRAEISSPARSTAAGDAGAAGRLSLPASAGFGTPDTHAGFGTPDTYTLAKPQQGGWSGVNSLRGGSSGGVWDSLGEAASRMGGIMQDMPGPGGPAADAQTRMGGIVHEMPGPGGPAADAQARMGSVIQE
jgi:hypothetical protein